MFATAVAGEVWRRHGLGLPVDLRRLAGELGLKVVLFPFEGRVREAIIGDTIGLRPGLSRPWFRWYVAHAIGHHLLHVGDSFHLEAWQWVGHAKAERQAEVFAAALVTGPDGRGRSPWELGVPGDKLPLVRSVGGSLGEGE